MASDPPENMSGTERTYPAFRTPDSDDRTADTARKFTTPRTPFLSSTGLDSGARSPFDDDHNAGVDPEKYRVIRKLGDGGMGTVWLVEHIKLGQKRAIKVVKADVALDPIHRARFEQEAKILAKLVHPNAVVVHDFVIFGGVAYIDMEYLEGDTLRKRLKAGDPMPLMRIDWLLHELCEVLGQAHRLGIVHRDIKPENIMILTDSEIGRDQVKVLDFGIAKIVQDAGTESGAMTFHTESPLGTYHYASPEQLNYCSDPLKRRKVDQRSDIYSLGVLLYELVTGSRPFTGVLTKLLYDHANTPPPPFAEKVPHTQVDPAVEKIVLQCLQKQPGDRPQSAQQLYQLFHEAVVASRSSSEECFQTTEADDAALADARRRRAERLVPPGGQTSLLTKFGLARPYRRKAIVGVALISCLIVGIAIPLSLAILDLIRPPDIRKPPDIEKNPPIRDRVAKYLETKGYRTATRVKFDKGWPTRIERISGLPRPMALHGCVYIPANFRPDPDRSMANGIPTAIVETKSNTRFVLIEGDTFTMGAWSDGDPFTDDEKPGHKLTLSSYYMQETEVTNGEIERYLKEKGLTRTDPQLRDFFMAIDDLANDLTPEERKNRPAVCVSRALAEEYAHQVGGELPSEAQWEFAARSRGKQRLYAWGDDDKGVFVQDRKAHVNSISPTRDINTLSVEFINGDRTDQGVLHMMGNVREWCRDVWRHYPKSQTPLDHDHVEVPSDGEADPKFVIRGGSYLTPMPIETARLTFRSDCRDLAYRAQAAQSFLDVGFRVVVEIVIEDSVSGE
jgi:eukaryotic-like serine/threonine-protein kinase